MVYVYFKVISQPYYYIWFRILFWSLAACRLCHSWPAGVTGFVIKPLIREDLGYFFPHFPFPRHLLEMCFLSHHIETIEQQFYLKSSEIMGTVDCRRGACQRSKLTVLTWLSCVWPIQAVPKFVGWRIYGPNSAHIGVSQPCSRESTIFMLVVMSINGLLNGYVTSQAFKWTFIMNDH